MIVTLLSWLYIFFITMTLGLGCCLICAGLLRSRSRICRTGKNPAASENCPGRALPLPDFFGSPETWILTGLAASAVYAQIFSLFGGVGAFANVLLSILCFALLISFRDKIGALLKNAFRRPLRSTCIRIGIAAVLVIYTAVLTAQTPSHYDTYLYHAQAIRWIEEYGCVIGLGNLHNRFAYNSSFLVLQALFSLKFAVGTSLHTLNGFIAAVFLCWNLLTLRFPRTKGCFVSDALRIGFVYYLLHNSSYLSSPNTDTFALALAFYIFTKWTDLLEKSEFLWKTGTRPEAAGRSDGSRVERSDRSGEGTAARVGASLSPWCWLCLMAVFACTLKLSSAFLLVLLIKPLSMIIRERRWKPLVLCVLAASALTLPFFLRSVLISGYVLYPYSALDIISFADWKMSADVLDYDRLEIMAWGRAVYDVTALDQPILQWLPSWFRQQDSVAKREILCAAVSAAGLVILSIGEAIISLRQPRRPGKGPFGPPANAARGPVSDPAEKTSDKSPASTGLSVSKAIPCADRLLLTLTALVCLAGWLLSAPLVRYGEVYLIIVTALFVLSLPEIAPQQIQRLLRRSGLLLPLTALVLTLLRCGMMIHASYPYGLTLQYQDYLYYECEAIEWEGLTIYVTGDLTQAGYDPFPAIIAEDTLSDIERRGDSIRDGFRTQ